MKRIKKLLLAGFAMFLTFPVGTATTRCAEPQEDNVLEAETVEETEEEIEEESGESFDFLKEFGEVHLVFHMDEYCGEEMYRTVVPSFIDVETYTTFTGLNDDEQSIDSCTVYLPEGKYISGAFEFPGAEPPSSYSLAPQVLNVVKGEKSEADVYICDPGTTSRAVELWRTQPKEQTLSGWKQQKKKLMTIIILLIAADGIIWFAITKARKK